MTKKLSTDIDSLKNDLDTIRWRQNRKKFEFQYMLYHKSRNQGTLNPVKFATQMSQSLARNEAYNPNTGKFVVPFGGAGLYLFRVQFRVRDKK